MRTFEQALKVLAEKMPMRFLASETGWMFAWEKDTNGYWLRYPSYDLTQDDIDDILAEIGWEYEVTHGLTGYKYLAVDGRWDKENRQMLHNHPFASKLETARAALIAVVEQLWPEGK